MNEFVELESEAALPKLVGLDQKIVLEDQQTELPWCQIKALNDVQAARVWANLYRTMRSTYLAYRREVERLLLWCSYERGAGLKDLKVEDFAAYFDFLTNLPSHWYTNRAVLRMGRDNPNWRPFLGPLTESAFLSTVRILNSFLNYLVRVGYLSSNPIQLMRTQKIIKID